MSRRPDEPLVMDEMFAPALARALCEAGFDVAAVAGHPVLASVSDEWLAAWSAEQGRRVVTENVRDFAPLVGGGDPPLRVLFTSSRRFPRSRRNPGPLLEALHNWLSISVEHPVESWLR